MLVVNGGAPLVSFTFVGICVGYLHSTTVSTQPIVCQTERFREKEEGGGGSMSRNVVTTCWWWVVGSGRVGSAHLDEWARGWKTQIGTECNFEQF